jgi:hypothetical protein
VIDRASFDIDITGDANDTRCVFILEGDFTSEFEQYLANETAGVVSLKVHPDVARKLADQIGRWL